jgi:hypothetical protein
MGNNWNHMSPDDGGHPNNLGQYAYIHPPATDPDRYFTAVAMSALALGDDLLNDAAWLLSTMVGTPHSLLFTPSAAITFTATIRGRNQFGEQVSESVTVAAAAVRTLWAYKSVSSIIITTWATSGNTLTIGTSLTGIRMGLPIKVTKSAEVAGINTGAAGAMIANLEIDTQYSVASLSAGALTNVPHIVAYDLDAIGNRA